MNTQATAQGFVQGSPEAFLAQAGNYSLQPGDFDLVSAARAILARHLNNDPVRLAIFDNEPNVVTARQLTTSLQLRKLNMFLNSQYSFLTGDISVHCNNILQGATSDLWLKMFETYHAPLIARVGLPVAY